MANATTKTRLTETATVNTWKNGEREAHAGHCATISMPKVGAWGCATEREALEQMAAQLERLAAELRALVTMGGAS